MTRALFCLAFVTLLVYAAADANTTTDAENATQPATAAASSTSTSSGEMLSATTRLFNTLLVTFVAVFLGLASVRFGVVNPKQGDTKGLGFLIGQIVFPLLIFKTVVTARLDGLSFGVVAACTCGKLVTMLLTWVATFFFYKGDRPRGDRFLTATVFAAYVISSNDFAVGFPVVDALYGQKVDMGIYITANSLVGASLFVPLLTVLFNIGTALRQQDENDGSDSAGKENQCLKIMRSVILNPVILMTIAALVYKGLLGFTLVDNGMAFDLPHPLSDLLDLISSPFTMCALFLTGTSLGTPKVTLTPLLLVIMKVVVCAYATYAFGAAFISSRDPMHNTLENFTFLYGMIPTSSAPLIFCQEYAPDSMELTATSILIGLMLAGPMMYAAALFLEAANINMEGNLAVVSSTTTVASLICGVVVIVLMACLLGVWKFNDAHQTLLVGYAVFLMVYEALMATISPYLGNTGCTEFNERNGWSSMGILIGGFQNAARFIFLSMQICLLWSYRPAGRGPSCGFDSRGMIMFAASLALGFVASLVVFPNTLIEICSAGGQSTTVDNQGVGPNVAWSLILLVVTVTLLAMALARRNKNMTDEEEFSAGKPKESSLNTVVKCLAIFFILRYFVQVINAGKVVLGSSVKGSFAEMLVVENLMEHGQLIILLFVLINDQDFSNHVGEVMQRMFPWLRKITLSSPTSRLVRQATVFPDQVFDFHQHSPAERSPDAVGHDSEGDQLVVDDGEEVSETSSEASSGVE